MWTNHAYLVVSMTTNQSPIAAALSRNRLQQKHVAEALGVSRMAVLAWYHGRSVPTGENLIKLADYLRTFEPSISERDLLPTPAAA